MCEWKLSRNLKKNKNQKTELPVEDTTQAELQKMQLITTELSKNTQKLGEELLRTCVGMSFRTKTGLAPEITRFSALGLRNDEGAMHNALRPETVESLFYYWRY